MVMEASPSPQSVGREFVRQYYTLLNKAPTHLHRFYNNYSSFVHGGLDAPNRETLPVIGQKQIHNKIQQLNFRDCHAKISQVDSQATLGNGVVVQVSGELSNAGAPMRRFTQTFVLAAQSPKKYYVHNDIFRYQDEVCGEDESEAECGGSEHSEEAYLPPASLPPAPPVSHRPFHLARLPHLNGHDDPGTVANEEPSAAEEEEAPGLGGAGGTELEPLRSPSPPPLLHDELPAPTEPKTYANLLKSASVPVRIVTVTEPRAPPPPPPESAVRVSRATPAPARVSNPPVAPGDNARRYSDTQQLFFGNVPYSATEDELRLLFGKFGVVVELKVHTKPGGVGSRNSNYGFVTYEEALAAARCLQADLRFPDTPDGCKINVEKKARGGRGGARGAAGGRAAPAHRPAFPPRAPPAYRR